MPLATGTLRDGDFAAESKRSQAAAVPGLLQALASGARRPPSTRESKAVARIAEKLYFELHTGALVVRARAESAVAR